MTFIVAHYHDITALNALYNSFKLPNIKHIPLTKTKCFKTYLTMTATKSN